MKGEQCFPGLSPFLGLMEFTILSESSLVDPTWDKLHEIIYLEAQDKEDNFTANPTDT